MHTLISESSWFQVQYKDMMVESRKPGMVLPGFEKNMEGFKDYRPGLFRKCRSMGDAKQALIDIDKAWQDWNCKQKAKKGVTDVTIFPSTEEAGNRLNVTSGTVSRWLRIFNLFYHLDYSKKIRIPPETMTILQNIRGMKKQRLNEDEIRKVFASQNT